MAYRKDRWWLIVILALLAVPRIIYLVSQSNSLYFHILFLDPYSYDSWALKILSEGWIGKEVFYQDPLYPYFLAFVYSIFGHSYMMVRIIQAVLGCATGMLIYLLASRLLNTRVASAAAIIYATYLEFVMFEGMIEKTSLGIFLSTFFLYLLVSGAGNGSTEPKPYLLFAAGFIAALACMVRGNLLIFLPIVVLWLLFRGAWNRGLLPGIKPAFAFAASALMVISLPSIRNSIIAKEPVLITAQAGQNFYIGNNPTADGSFRPPPFMVANPQVERISFSVVLEKKLGGKLSATEASRYWFRQSIFWIKSKPRDFTRLLWRKCRLFWGSYKLPDNMSWYFMELFSPLLRLSPLDYGAIISMAVVGMIISIPRRSHLLILYLFIITYSASVIAFFVVSRYRIVILPVLMIFAAASIVRFIELIGSINPRNMLKAAAMFAIFLATWWVLKPTAQQRELIKRDMNNGFVITTSLINNHFYRDLLSTPLEEMFLLSGSLDEFMPPANLPDYFIKWLPELESAAQRFRSPDSRYCVALAYESAGHYEDAEFWYRKSLAHHHDIDKVIKSIARVLRKRGDRSLIDGDTQSAFEFYRAAQQYDPDDQTLLSHIAILQYRLGLVEPAVNHLVLSFNKEPSDIFPLIALSLIALESEESEDLAIKALWNITYLMSNAGDDASKLSAAILRLFEPYLKGNAKNAELLTALQKLAAGQKPIQPPKIGEIRQHHLKFFYPFFIKNRIKSTTLE